MTHARTHRAFTLIEVTVATLIVALMLAASLNSVGYSRAAMMLLGDRARAALLAEDLMNEILDQPYRDPDAPSDAIGPDDSEAATGDRTLFNDVDDYHQWTATPPTVPDGTPIDGAENLTRHVQVAWVKAGNLNTLSPISTGLKRITVIVTRGDHVLARQVAVRTLAWPGLFGQQYVGDLP